MEYSSLSSCLLYIRGPHFEESSYTQHFTNSLLPHLPLIIHSLETTIVPCELILWMEAENASSLDLSHKYQNQTT